MKRLAFCLKFLNGCLTFFYRLLRFLQGLPELALFISATPRSDNNKEKEKNIMFSNQ